jgi:hypothetical protein
MNFLFGSTEHEGEISGPAMAAFLEMERSVDIYSRFCSWLLSTVRVRVRVRGRVRVRVIG